MSILDPANTTLGDMVTESLKLSGRLALGQTALAEDATLGWTYMQMMLQQWDQDSLKVYRLADVSVTSTGAQSYTLGPGGDLDTGASSVRPPKVSSAFVRQISVNAPNQPDWPLEMINSKLDYNKIRLKMLTSLSQYLFYDPTWPLGTVYPWPVLQSDLYSLHLSVYQQLPFVFITQADVFNIPYIYYWAMVTNLALRLRARYRIPTYPGDNLPEMAKQGLAMLKETNVTIPTLSMPSDISVAGGAYNIFSDSYNH